MVGCHELLAKIITVNREYNNLSTGNIITVNREASVGSWVSSPGVEVNETPENQPLAL